MRQLLSRKSRPKLSDEHQEYRSSIPGQGASTERVFPVRNGNVRSTADLLPPLAKQESLNFDEMRSRDVPNRTSSINRGTKSDRLSSNSAPPTQEEPRKIADTSQYIFSNSGPPRIQQLLRCEDEPIHIPGAVQTFGALLGVKYNRDGQLEVRIASENCRKVLGYGPEQLFALPSFLDVLKHDVRDEMVARVNHVLSDTDALKEETRLDVFQMTLTFPYEPEIRLWCAIHLAPNPKGMVICEFEEYLDAFYLKDADVGKILPVNRVHHLGFDDAPPEDFEKSTKRASQPLPVIEVARQKENKEFTPMDIFNAMTQSQKQINSCDSVQRVMDISVGIISDLTGFHRVMFYSFDAQKNGCVDAEILNPAASTDVYRGLHYPASDIPKQARELYKVNRIRILYDRDAVTAKLVCRSESDMEQPLDLTHSYLRAMSPVHNKYLRNMGVRSTMSVSIVINNDLWGLIACHGYGDLGIRVSLPIRELCRSIGESAASKIERLSMQQRISARRVPVPTPSNQNPTGFIANSSADLLRLVDADFALFSIDDEARAVGRLEPYKEALAIVSYLQSCRFTAIRSTHNITADFPGFSFPNGLKTIAGLLYIPLNNAGDGNNFLVFFRKGQEKHVKWAGNPHDKKMKAGTTSYLEPRTSFARWSETIVGSSKEWTEDQLDTASILGLLYGRSIDAWQQKTSGSPSSGEIDDAPADVPETFNLGLTVSKLMKGLQKEAERKELDLTVSVHDRLPAMVKGDAAQFKQVIVYFTGNGFKQSTSVKVDINHIRTKDHTSIIGLVFEDTGPGLTESQLDDVFEEFEQAQEEGWPLPPNQRSSQLSQRSPRQNGHSGPNTDLPAIARYVRNVNGQVLVTSEIGKGTTFSLELPFEHAPLEQPKPRKLRYLFSPSSQPKGSSPPSTLPSTKPKPKSNEANRRSVNRNSPSPVQTPLNILIAEDDAISRGILEEKLAGSGHIVDVTSNGQECHGKFAANPAKYDIILMDLDMPIVDGNLSTKMIRFLEKESKQDPEKPRPRVPIIALSPSFVEDSRLEYMSNGFDGWILKPLDFRMLDQIMQGVKTPTTRIGSLYIPGAKGGWFLP